MKRKYSNELKAGMVIVLALIGLGYITFQSGDFRFQKKGYKFFVTFNDTMGLEENAPVRLRGVEVGHVQSQSVNYTKNDTNIILTLWINSKYKIRGIPKINIRTLGMMGEKYIQIIDKPGITCFLQPETVVAGEDPVDFEAVLSSAQEVVNNTNSLILETKSLMQNANLTLTDNRQAIDAIVENLKNTSANFDELSQDLKHNPWKIMIRTKEKTTHGK